MPDTPRGSAACYQPDGSWSCIRDHVTEPCGDCDGCRLVRAENATQGSAACVRCGNPLGPEDFFEDGETRPHIIHNSDEPDEHTEGPLCMRDFRIGVGVGVWHECPTCGGKGKVREEGT